MNMAVGIAKRYVLFTLLGLLGLFMLQGCGSNSSASQGEPKPPGVTVDPTLSANLAKSFDEVKACAGLTTGEFKDIAVVVMPAVFPCQWYKDGCSGEFDSPNTIKVGSPHIWKHEVIHYLLYLSTGDSDPTHQSPLFQSCIF
ncbi:MAG: hypothetical protein ACE5HN_01280 [Nitrospiria bacterium]